MFTTAQFVTFLRAYAQRLAELQPLLDQLDNQIGDGDHGTNMARGFQAAVPTQVATDDLGALCNQVAMTLLSKVGGASGPLYATVFMRFAALWKGKSSVDEATLAESVRSALQGLIDRGKASVGDKTMIDVWTPAAAALTSEDPLRAAAKAAVAAAIETKTAVAKKGRAAYLGERSVGVCDPGSVSSAVFFEELAAAVLGGVEKTEWAPLVS